MSDLGNAEAANNQPAWGHPQQTEAGSHTNAWTAQIPMALRQADLERNIVTSSLHLQDRGHDSNPGGDRVGQRSPTLSQEHSRPLLPLQIQPPLAQDLLSALSSPAASNTSPESPMEDTPQAIQRDNERLRTLKSKRNSELTEHEKKEKMRLANRESARKLRQRRVDEVNTLRGEVTRLEQQNAALVTRLKEIGACYCEVAAENANLRNEAQALRAMQNRLGVSFPTSAAASPPPTQAAQTHMQAMADAGATSARAMPATVGIAGTTVGSDVSRDGATTAPAASLQFPSPPIPGFVNFLGSFGDSGDLAASLLRSSSGRDGLAHVGLHPRITADMDMSKGPPLFAVPPATAAAAAKPPGMSNGGGASNGGAQTLRSQLPWPSLQPHDMDTWPPRDQL